MTNHNDKILDACLEEVLGNRTPPELTARILAAWGQAAREPVGPPMRLALLPQPPMQPPVQPPRPNPGLTPVPPPIAQEIGWVLLASQSMRMTGRPGAMNPWASIGLVGLVLVVGTALGLVGLQLSTSSQPQPNTIAKGTGSSRNLGATAGRSPRRDSVAANTAPHRVSPNGDFGGATAPNRDEVPPVPDMLGGKSTAPNAVGEQPPVAPRLPSASSVSDEAVVTLINESIRHAWDLAGIKAAEPATDAEWCRRTFLRIIGRIPTVVEVERYTSPAPQGSKRSQLVDELLGPRYADEYASHWASIWTNALLGRADVAAGGGASRDGLTEFLRQSLVENKPYDRMAAELIVATGSNQRVDEDYNPAVNFLLAHAQGPGTQAAGRVARVFLGARLQCAECHVHPTGTWSQDQLWQLASFFRQMKARRDAANGTVRLVNEDFRGEGRDPDEAASYFELSNGQLKAAFPVFLDGQAGSRSGLVSTTDRRRELAEFVERSPQFAQTAVNRLWAHFLGFGFTQPVDDLGPHNRASHPELLEHVAADFAGQGFDLARLIRWIVLSEPFGLSSKGPAGQLADAAEMGVRPLFARYYSRPMQPEELSKSLQMLADARVKGAGGSAEQARLTLLRQLGRALPPDDTDDSRGIRQPISQALILVQRDLAAHATSGQDGSLIRKVAENSAMSVDQKIEHLFQAALARKPAAREIQAARRLVADSPADVAQGLNDIWWVLLNSNEFILDH